MFVRTDSDRNAVHSSFWFMAGVASAVVVMSVGAWLVWESNRCTIQGILRLLSACLFGMLVIIPLIATAIEVTSSRASECIHSRLAGRKSLLYRTGFLASLISFFITFTLCIMLDSAVLSRVEIGMAGTIAIATLIAMISVAISMRVCAAFIRFWLE